MLKVASYLHLLEIISLIYFTCMCKICAIKLLPWDYVLDLVSEIGSRFPIKVWIISIKSFTSVVISHLNKKRNLCKPFSYVICHLLYLLKAHKINLFFFFTVVILFLYMIQTLCFMAIFNWVVFHFMNASHNFSLNGVIVYFSPVNVNLL